MADEVTTAIDETEQPTSVAPAVAAVAAPVEFYRVLTVETDLGPYGWRSAGTVVRCDADLAARLDGESSARHATAVDIAVAGRGVIDFVGS